MKCPNCNGEQVFVIDSRMSGDKRRRRYECFDCKERFTTYEMSVGDVMALEEMKDEVRLNTIEEIITLVAKQKGVEA